MKKLLMLTIAWLCMLSYKGYAQNCADDFTDITQNQFVCSSYGDANGNSNWNWEIKPTDPNFCKHWCARTSSISTKLTTMGSPFVNSPTTSLDAIAISEDYTRAKGWELIQRDFGCTHNTAYPYFVLYNKYTSLIRVYIYKTETQEGFTSMLVTMEPTTSAPYPATTSLGDTLAGTPEAFLNSNQSKKYGKQVVSVTEQGGFTRWTVAEFNPGFDPNIQNGVYAGAGLKFTIYGVVTNDMKAVIKGRSVSGSDPSLYSFSYVPKKAPTSANSGQTYDFSGLGDKYSKFSKSLTEMRNVTKTFADRVKQNVSQQSPSLTSLEGRVMLDAGIASDNSNNDQDFLKMLGKATDGLTTATGSAGTILKFVGEMIGLFSGGSSTKPASMPTYTSYDMELQGTLTAKTVQESFIIRVPGSIQNDNNNASYYKCPLGLVNIKNIPKADMITYTRVDAYKRALNFDEVSKSDYLSLRMKNDLGVSYNSNELDLVSIQAAVVGRVRPNSNGAASYDLFKKTVRVDNPNDLYYAVRDFNFMRPDLETGRMQIATYDTEKKLHTFQTKYVNIECLNGLTFNARKETDVFLRVKAILKRKNDPDNAPIYYIRDYEIDINPVTIDPVLQQRHNSLFSWQYALPYSNYIESPTYVSDVLIHSIVYNNPTEIKADNSITTENEVDVKVPDGQSVSYKTGAVIDLNPGFEAEVGSDFEASINTYGYNITCGTPNIEAFQFNGSCFNTTASGLRTVTKSNTQNFTSDIISVYPIPTNGQLVITGIYNSNNAIITILDQSGRTIREIRAASYETSGQINLDVSTLQNGVYFVKIQTGTQTITKKIVISK
jgi:hypothetical protein